MMILSQSIKPISYLKQNTASAIKEVNENNSSLIITQNGEAKAILIDLKSYEQEQESLALLKMIAQSKQAYNEGQYQTAKDAFTDIKLKITGTSV
jgi:prevent-host-death family protein